MEIYGANNRNDWNARIAVAPRVALLSHTSYMREELKNNVGIRKSITIPAMSAGDMLQYDMNGADLKPFRRFPYINALYVDNNDNDSVLTIDLDAGDQRRMIIPKLSMKSYGGLSFLAFNLTAASDVSADTVKITAAYEVNDTVKVSGIGGGG